MNKKLMLIASGALAALALAALPAVASGGEFAADCESGAATCEGTVTGGVTQIRNDNGEAIQCTSFHGTASVTSTTSTGSISLEFLGCKENITGFGFSCTNTGTAGKITTGAMVTHLIYLEHNATTPGLKITLPGHGTSSGGVTYNCAGFSKRTVTGSLIGHLENPSCGTFQPTHSAEFTESSTGVQRWMHATTTGSTTDLISNNDAGGAYTTTSVTTTTTIHWINNRVKFTC